MSDLFVSMIPIFVMWTLPLAPMLFAAAVGLVEALIAPFQRAGRASGNALTGGARAGARQPADASVRDQQAA